MRRPIVLAALVAVAVLLVAGVLIARLNPSATSTPPAGAGAGRRASDLPKCPAGMVHTVHDCRDPSSGEFTDRGNHTETLFVERDGVTTMHSMDWGALSRGTVPRLARPTHGASPTPKLPVPQLQWRLPDGSTFQSGLKLRSTTCKAIDETYVYAYVCFYRYALTAESDRSKDYGTVWSVGIAQGQGSSDASCAASTDHQCLARVRTKFTINERSNWCDSSSDPCAIDNWSPASCCTKTKDGETQTASLGLDVGSSAAISTDFRTYRDRYGVENIRWPVHSHDWWSISASVGRGTPIWIERAGGAEYYWRHDRTQPMPTYYVQAWDSFGYMYP